MSCVFISCKFSFVSFWCLFIPGVMSQRNRQAQFLFVLCVWFFFYFFTFLLVTETIHF